jgi:hypothetical protein
MVIPSHSSAIEAGNRQPPLAVAHVGREPQSADRARQVARGRRVRRARQQGRSGSRGRHVLWSTIIEWNATQLHNIVKLMWNGNPVARIPLDQWS